MGGKAESASTAAQTDYAAQLEAKLEEVIGSIEGAGETQVMITLLNGVEYIYASEDSISLDTSESSDDSGRRSSDARENTQKSCIIIDTDEGEQALVRTELSPTVGGVVVVCEGAADPIVRERILQIVTTALAISSKRVCISPSGK